MSKIALLPGTPVTAMALDMPAGAIRNSTGSNTHVMAHNPVACKKVFADDREDTWLEYVPTTYDPAQKVPLVISCHGGGVNGAVQCDETSWNYVAELEGLIVVYPSAGTNRAWLFEGEKGNVFQLFSDEEGKGVVSEEAHDLRFLCGLIEEMKRKYNIDGGRVYMQGMSMGDIMTMMFSRVHGDLLAGAANAAGPSCEKILFYKDGTLKQYKCPVPVYQSRGELDAGVVAKGYDPDCTRQDVNAANRRFWLQVNECDAEPALSIRGENNVAFYTGKKANLVYRDVKHRDHGQTFDDAMWAWYTLFSGTRRNEDGTLTITEPLDAHRADRNTAALAIGCKYAYVDNKKVALSGTPYYGGVKTYDAGKKELVDYLKVFYAPISFLAEYFSLEIQLTQGGRTATIVMPEGNSFTVSEGSIGCVHNNRILSMICPPEVHDGQMYLPLKWFASNLFGRFVTECDGALYIAGHHGEMTKDMAGIIRELLKESETAF